MKEKLLKFSSLKNNAKLNKMGGNAYSFSLPAGWSCPFANECLSKAHPVTGKITDGPNTQFRCFSASSEAIFTPVRKQRHHNFNLLKKTSNKAVLITNSLPKDVKIVRVHVSGDFYNEDYFKAWVKVANMHPKVIFYGYTKSIPYLVKYKDELPENFRFTASFGGKADEMIEPNELKSVKVVYHPNEAKKMKLKIDHDDSLAIKGDKSFALLIHGVQPKNGKGAAAQKIMKQEGIEYGYHPKKN